MLDSSTHGLWLITEHKMYMSMLNDTVFVLPTSVDIAPHDKVEVSGTHLFNTPDPTIR